MNFYYFYSSFGGMFSKYTLPLKIVYLKCIEYNHYKVIGKLNREKISKDFNLNGGLLRQICVSVFIKVSIGISEIQIS